MKTQVLKVFSNLTNEQKRTLLNLLTYNLWGDTQIILNGKPTYVWGYVTEWHPSMGSDFSKKQAPAKFKALLKALKLEGNNKDKQNQFAEWHYDWWGDGSGSILLIDKYFDLELNKVLKHDKRYLVED